MKLTLPALSTGPRRPVVLCILDGVGLGRRDDGDAVFTADTPVLDAIMARYPCRSLKAHGTAVGLPSDEDMGNSEVGHNAMGAGRVFQQGAALVDLALARDTAFRNPVWPWLCEGGTLHLIGLVSDGNVHSNTRHLDALLEQAAKDGVQRLRVHALTDGRDVQARSALRFIEPLEATLARLSAEGRDYRIASGGGRMHITMDRYNADWEMVRRGWDCHVHGQGRPFPSASAAIRQLYAESTEVNDQTLPAFVVTEGGQPVGRIHDGDGVLFFNFRGDRAIEISMAFEGRPVPFDRGQAPAVRFAGLMQYDGDEQVPRRYLVSPPEIDRTVGAYLAANGKRSFAVAETQKYGHVTYFFNGNCSGYLDPELEEYVCVPSRQLPFDQIPEMEAAKVADAAVAAIASGRFDHVRMNFANGDMVGHTGDFNATLRAMEAVDSALGRVIDATVAAGGVALVTADHGNADQMFQTDKKSGRYQLDEAGHRVVRTAHSLNPVPFVLIDPRQQWTLAELPDAGIASIGGTVLALCGLQPPADYDPILIRSAP